MTVDSDLRATAPADTGGSTRLAGIAGWAARTSIGLARTGFGLARKLPGAGEVERRFQTFERVAASGLRQWLDIPAQEQRTLERTEQSSGLLVPTSEIEGNSGETDHQSALRAVVAELLHRSAVSSRDQARDYLYASILRLITPDEARLLAALGEGAVYPAVHVVERSIGNPSRFLLRNGSSAGRAAGVALPDEVPHYLTRLQALGLVEIGPPLSSADDQYELLQTDSRVRAAMQSAKNAKVIRRSVRISGLGARFWQRCDPSAL